MTEAFDLNEQIQIRNLTNHSLQYKIYRGVDGNLYVDIEPKPVNPDDKLKTKKIFDWAEAQRKVRKRKIVYCREWEYPTDYLFFGNNGTTVYKHELRPDGMNVSYPYDKESDPDAKNFFCGGYP